MEIFDMPAAISSRNAASPSRRKVATRTRKKTSARSKATRRKTAIERIEGELPKDLRDFSRIVRRDLGQLEKQIEGARKDVRRGLTRALREVSHQLGRFEADGERRWKKLTSQARRDAVKVLRNLEKVIEPPKRKRKAARKKPKTGPAGG